MKLEMNATIRRNSEIVHSDMDGEIVMMSIQNGFYYGLNEIGSRIWDMLESDMSVQAICTSLETDFEVNEEQCREEVAAFLDKMVEQKVIEITPA